MAEFSSDVEIRKVSPLLEEMFTHVLHDEDPLFISDEATLWAVSMSDTDEVLERFRRYYGVPISMEETKQPLWKFLQSIDARRKTFTH